MRKARKDQDMQRHARFMMDRIKREENRKISDVLGDGEEKSELSLNVKVWKYTYSLRNWE
jgi:hypothetical protein